MCPTKQAEHARAPRARHLCSVGHRCRAVPLTVVLPACASPRTGGGCRKDGNLGLILCLCPHPCLGRGTDGEPVPRGWGLAVAMWLALHC